VRTQQSEPVRVVVTGGGSLLGQGILRAMRFSALRFRTTVVDISPLAPGLHWADEAFLVPPAVSPRYLDSIRAVLSASKPDILFVGTDVELGPLAAMRDVLGQDCGTKVLVSSPDVVAIADDKYETVRFLRENGFVAPGSARSSDRDGIDRLVEMHGFPLVVKPCVGARSYGVSVVRDRRALERAVANVEDYVVQECIGNDDQEYTASGLYFDGRCDAVIVMRRDLRDGNTFRAFTVRDAELDGLVKRWIEALKPLGPANFQFRIDSEGVPKVFEINARFSGTTPLRAHAGFNEVEMCVRRMLWDDPIVQPEIAPLTILRHWSETVIDPEAAEAVEPL
jgi:carbamoyl-phosphate synthase large subunit